MFIGTVLIESLAYNSYVIGSEQSGWCAVIDPVRDVDHYTTIAANHGVRINYALETHLHDDFYLRFPRTGGPEGIPGGGQRLRGPAASNSLAPGGR